MSRWIVLVILCVAGASTAFATERSPRGDERALLMELGALLSQPPDSAEDCQALLVRIRSWKEDKLREIEVPITNLHITVPLDGAKVSERPVVEGVVADPHAEVWLIVHPLEVSDYWVEPAVAVKDDGTWRTTIYVGRPGAQDVGKRFEVIAVANPKTALDEGKKLPRWPDAQWKSQVIEVIRK